MATKVIHELPLRESAHLAVETLADGRLRLALRRRSPASDDPADFTVVAAIAFDRAQAREIVAAIRTGLLQLEAESEEEA